MSRATVKTFEVGDFYYTVHSGNSGDAYIAKFSEDMSRADSSNIRLMISGSQRMIVPGGEDQILKAGMNTDQLPDVKAGEYKWVYEEDGCLSVCISRKGGLDFGYEIAKADAGHDFHLKPGTGAVFCSGEFSVVGNRLALPKVVMADCSEFVASCSSSGTVLVFWRE